MKTRYSKLTNCFYPLDGNYKPEDLPADLVIVPIDTYRAAMERPLGYSFDIVGGECIIAAPLPETEDEARTRALINIRTQRAPMLVALDGIANRAFRKGDAETAQAADVAAQALLDITALPAFLGAATYDTMKEAIMARYREISAAAPETVQTVFREVLG